MKIDVSFVESVDPEAFKDLLRDYYTVVLKTFSAAGGPELSAAELAKSSIDHLDEMLPPKGRLALARGGRRATAWLWDTAPHS